ncbi:zonular occludens toxin domain-containing protein [Pseudoalteromonas sp. B530]|uniref:zonular occludens toxin domain-containing protein n=1 Tax=Pseudoalteromonas sp. B530 TaxID=2994390 RepID=UPI00224B9EDC|nr:zonular occludens toxin domain-containing protein [Pseudoalteromonas sp. B530]MCX2765443.1 hypothetical protein [Pseudoalteromonas sp. B530]MCX2765454.1 hypothetical protein [Pseudoalteromonas sp. B530]
MIYLITGRPRSGKTYEAVKYHIIPAIQSGRVVITNLPLNIDHFKKIHGTHVEQLIKVVDFDYSDFHSSAVTFPFSKPEHYQDDWRDNNGVGPLYVVDEAHFSLPKGGTHRSVKKFYTMHGHYGVDILLMTQHQRQMDQDILELVEIVYRTIKNTALGSNSTYTKKVQDGNKGAIVNTEQRRYDTAIFPYYKSHTQSKKDVLEREASDIKPIWKHWSVYGAIFCFAFVLFIIITQDVNPISVTPPKTAQSEHQESTVLEFKEPNSQVQFINGEKVDSQFRMRKNEEKDDSQFRMRKNEEQGAAKSRAFPGEHPFYRVQLHVSGYADVGTRKNPVRRVFFDASRNGQTLFKLELKDLLLAGYDVKVLGDCLIHITFSDFEDFLVCDTPTVGVSVPIEGEPNG